MINLLVGLGNPGKGYENTKHNIGFEVIDQLIRYFNSSSFNNRFYGLYTKISNKLLLFKPMTYINNSGTGVAEIAKFFRIIPSNIIVFHDDLDLKVGKIKVKLGGGNGGHNGLKSIDQYLGQGYWRVRIGISKPQYKEQISDYVLKKFSNEQQEVIDLVVKKIVKNIDTLLHDNKDRFLLAFYNDN